MSRVNRMKSSNSNPAEKFFEWKSDHQKFCYWDREKEENIFVELPMKFLAIASYKTVKGFNAKFKGGGPKGTGMTCNEVRSITKDSNEILDVRYRDAAKTLIAKGKWADIKEAVDNADGKFTESVYAMLEDGTLVNFTINGAGLGTWYDFQKNQTDRFFDCWIEVKGFKDGKSGSVEYTFPVFEWGKSLTRAEGKLAEGADNKISDYEASYFHGKAVESDTEPKTLAPVAKVDSEPGEEKDELDF